MSGPLLDRDYFPQPKLTPPAPDAPTMAEVVAVICGARAHECICGREVGHDGTHECQRDNCGGEWLGAYPGSDFEVVRWPGSGVAS
jgi:hypothetical protein